MELGADIYKEAPNGETPLIAAIEKGDLDTMRLLVTELGVDVNQEGLGRPRGYAFFNAAYFRQFDVMRCLVEELGASTAVVFKSSGDAVFLFSVRHGRLESTHYLLEHGGATMTEKNKYGENVWDQLIEHKRKVQRGVLMTPPHDPEAMTALLKVMLLRDTPPPNLVALLLPADRLVVDKGARLRARLPAYLKQRRALVDAHCLLIPPLQALVTAMNRTRL
jgi:hypothetical protein